MSDKYEGRYFLEDEPGHSYMRGSFTSIEKAKKEAEKVNLPWWRVTAYNHETNVWDVLAQSSEENFYPSYEVGEPVLYQNGDRFELGIVKSVCGNDDYFINYHTGDTAARTNASHLHKISNRYAFHIIRLYPDGNERR